MPFTANTARMSCHVGMIPDGNRRWASERGLAPWDGHAKGAEKGELFIEWCIDHPDIAEMTVYALSEENFKRPADELGRLYRLYEHELTKLLQNEKIHRNRVRMNIVSTNMQPLPRALIRLFQNMRAATRTYERKTLNMLIGYTGQSEILRAVSSPLNRIRNLVRGLRERDLERGLQVRTPCDLIIRTGTEEKQREAKSGFLLWQSAYAEYYHINKFFPDVTAKDFDEAWDFFIHARRRRGL